jgi:hypothetical protein
MTAVGTKKETRWHLELKQRWVDQYNFYLNDSEWGRMFLVSRRTVVSALDLLVDAVGIKVA